MSRFRRNLVPVLLLLPVNLVCGKLLLTPRNVQAFDFLLLQRGWPWVFLESAEGYPNAIPFKINVFSFWMLAADLAVLLGIVALGVLLVVWNYRRHGGRYQLSLRSLLLLTAVAAMGFAWWFHEWSYSKRQEAFLQTFGNAICCSGKIPGPLWLRRLTGNDEIFERVVAISDLEHKPSQEIKDTLPAAIAELPSIRRYTMDWVPSQDDDLSVLLPFAELEPCGQFDDRTVRLLSQLPKLRVLDLAHRSSLTYRQAHQLAELTQIEHVTLPTETSPETVEFLKQHIRTVEVAPAEWIIDGGDDVSPEMIVRLRQEFRAAVERIRPKSRPDDANPPSDSATQ